MTPEQITQWAREACIALLVHHDGTQVTPQELQAFANLVRNAALGEAAAKCESLAVTDCNDSNVTRKECATVIRGMKS
jgi:hypothetical protein